MVVSSEFRAAPCLAVPTRIVVQRRVAQEARLKHIRVRCAVVFSVTLLATRRRTRAWSTTRGASRAQ